jgi:integrase
MLLRLRRSKTDSQGAGRLVAVERGAHSDTCPCATLKSWLLGSGVENGPLFRGISRHGAVGQRRLAGRAVARILQRRAAAVDLGDLDLAGHSLRSGFATAAAAAHVEERDIAERTGHRNLGVLRGYIHQGRPFENGLTQKLGF